MTTEVAPALSTAQSDAEFLFDKFQTKETKLRSYFPPHDPNNKEELRKLINEYYSINELLPILQGRFSKITLQFPDYLICDSTYVVQMLQEGLIPDKKEEEEEAIVNSSENELDYTSQPKNDHHCATCMNCGCGKKEEKNSKKISKYEVWVLADTSYSSCCTDEVAAEHVGAEVVVHFGDACLSPIKSLPSIYVFGKPFLQIEKLIENFKKNYKDDLDDKILLMADASCSYILKEMYEILKPSYKNLAYSEVFNDQKNIRIINYDFKIQKEKQGLHFGNRLLIGVPETDENGEKIDSLLQDYQLFHLTLPEPPRLLYLTTKFSSITVLNPKNYELYNGQFPSLMRRYRYMHIARTSGTIGVLVNTLSLDNTKRMVDIVAKWIKDADKKYYMFVVGKPNVAKLANFDAIDVWCILGCGQGGIIVDESSEYFKPIITPYELHLALSPEVTWTGKWVTEFKEILTLNDEENDENDEEIINSGDEGKLSDEDFAPEFSAVTGKYVSNSRPLRQIQHLQIELNNNSNSNNNDESQLVKKFSGSVVLKDTVSTSAIHLQHREWSGLGSDFKNDEEHDESGAVLEEGRSGIARGYEFDRTTHQN